MAFDAVFRPERDAPFRDTIAARLFLWPIESLLEREQYQAIVGAAALSAGDQAFAAALDWTERDWDHTTYRAVIDGLSYEDYVEAANPMMSEHVVFPPSGDWGVWVTDSEFAVIGGTSDFIEEVCLRLGYDELNAVRSFLEMWTEGNFASEWIPKTLDHVFGRARSEQLWPKR